MDSSQTPHGLHGLREDVWGSVMSSQWVQSRVILMSDGDNNQKSTPCSAFYYLYIPNHEYAINSLTPFNTIHHVLCVRYSNKHLWKKMFESVRHCSMSNNVEQYRTIDPKVFI